MYKRILIIVISFIFILDLNAQWVEQDSDFDTLRAIGHICAVDTNIVWAVAYDPGYLYPVSEYTKTTDGGLNWESGVISQADSFQLSMIYALNADLAYAALFELQGDTGKVLKTTDGGANWIMIDSLQFTSRPKLVYFWNENDGVVVADPDSNYFQIFTTNDGGTNWKQVEKMNMPVSQDGELTSQLCYSVVGDTFYFGGATNGKIYVTYDRGMNWSFIGAPLDIVRKVIFRDTVNGLIGDVNLITNSWEFYETKNGGLNWSLVETEGVVNYYDICYVPGTADAYVSSGYGLSQSSNAARTWIPFSPPSGGTSPFYTNLAFVNPTTGWAGGVNFGDFLGGIYKYSGVPLSISDNHEDYSNLEIYPNPGKGVFNIDLQRQDDNVNISVYNLLGTKVFFIEQFTPTIDLSYLTPGVYIVMIEKDKNLLKQKLIIQ